MGVSRCWVAGIVFGLWIAVPSVEGLQGKGKESAATEKKGVKAKAKAEAAELDPFGRPEGSIVDQTARYYIWYDSQRWHLRTTAKVGRNFNGTIRVKDARIKSCLSVGLKNDRQKKTASDAWQVNAARTELKYEFRTGQLSDGFDFVVEGDGEIEFELLIDTQKNPRAIFVGREGQHPSKNPFSLPVEPQRKK
jgi:hypothetical protein